MSPANHQFIYHYSERSAEYIHSYTLVVIMLYNDGLEWKWMLKGGGDTETIATGARFSGYEECCVKEKKKNHCIVGAYHATMDNLYLWLLKSFLIIFIRVWELFYDYWVLSFKAVSFNLPPSDDQGSFWFFMEKCG